MRLVTYGERGEERLGALVDCGRYVLDLNIASHGSIPPDPIAFLDGDYWDLARKVISQPAADVEPAALIEADSVRRGAPIPEPRTIIALGLNYRDHAEEGGQPVPPNPLLFAKAPAATIGPYDDIVYPLQVTQLDYEAELAIVIGKRAKNLTPEQAWNVIAGYMVINDVSARDIQFSESQWFRAKSFDTFAPMGPCLVTPDEIGDPQNLRIWCDVNGERLQNSTTANMIFKIPEIVAFISQVFTLRPGDVIATGTPAGVGVFRKPPRLLQVGDIVETGIEKIGILRNQVIAP
jgi:2-keto-4-pentenoate hydratase/2-oxohepta-3-ene-1,7-dioic acid hydratase in catechol pathway